MSHLQELTNELLQVRHDIAELRKRESQLEDLIAENMEKPVMVINGLGMIERHQKANRKQWKHDEIFSAVARMLDEIPNKREVDLSTGELLEETDAQKGMRVIKELANPTWRTTALKSYGLDPDEFCEVIKGGFSIRVNEGIEAA